MGGTELRSLDQTTKAIVGAVEILGTSSADEGVWGGGKHQFLLGRVVRFEYPVPIARGWQGLFGVDKTIFEQLSESDVKKLSILPRFAEAIVRKIPLKHDGNTDATYGDGSEYIANFLSPEQAQTSYQLVCKEIGVDPKTGVPLDETLLNPQDSREYFNRFQKNTDGTNWFPMPHVTGHFGSGKVGMIGSQSRNSSIRDHPEKIKRRVPFAEVPEINRLRRQVEEYLGKGDGWIRRANINVYKDGTSKLGAHRDGVHEGEFTVHTLSLGAGRHYLVECTASGAKTQIVLKGGSLNLLNSTTNETHTHSMVSQKGSCKPRISINFRR